MSSRLTIIMYHYVRELAKTRYPAIKARHTADFRSQLAHIRSRYAPVSMAEVVHSRRTGDPLPENAVLLTFDDGFIDHYTTCFPILFDAGIQGSFFPPVATAERSELLDVHRIHFILAVADAELLGRELDHAILQGGSIRELEAPVVYRAKWAAPTRFDSADTVYVKRMLQHVLPETFRNDLARELFARHVSMDEAAFACELYATAGQFKVMQSSGMYVGSHGDSHYWLNVSDEVTQRREIENSLKFLRAIGSPVDDFWVMCYPYGAWNDRLLKVLAEYGCALGLTTEVAMADLAKQNPLLLPRLDTNDIPVR